MLSPCWTCRYRSVRCDGVHPSCGQCAAVRIDCGGYSATQLTPDNDGREGIVARRRPEHVPGVPSSGSPAPAPDPTNSLYNEAQIIFEGIHYFNERVSGDLISVGSHFNPYQVPLGRIDKIPRIYVSLLVTTASLHKAMQQDAGSANSTLVPWEQYMFRFRGRALTEVNTRLGDTDTQTSDSTLMCVICLLLSTMQMSAYTDWRVHLEGARRIITMRGGLKAILSKNPRFKPLLAFFVAIDVVAATLAPSTHRYMPRATRMALKYWEVDPTIFQSNLAISAPWPEDLFQTLIIVNYLRTVCGKTEMTQRRHAGTRMTLAKVRSFDPAKWALRMEGFRGWKSTGDGVEFVDLRISPRSSPLSTLPLPQNRGGEFRSEASSDTRSTVITADKTPGTQNAEIWSNVGVIYKAALLLYILRTLILDIPEDRDFLFSREEEQYDIAALRLETRLILASSLAPIFSDVTTARELGKLVFFPAFMLGMEIDHNEAELQEFITNGLTLLGHTCGTLGPIAAVDELRCKWALDAAAPADSRVTWDEYFQERPDFIFGF